MMERALRAWRSLGSPAPGLLVAVSGGPDSVALLRALCAGRRTGDGQIVAAHLNHLLRGADSDADEAFVAGLAVALGATSACHRLDVAALARAEGGNLEAVARRERYAWLAGVAQAHGLRFVATGHTASDQAETVLHRIVRGTGLEGLRGIAPRRRLAAGVELVRPLLGVTRAEVLAFLAELGQQARHDASNDDPRFTRNRIRHELLPILARDYNPRVEEVLARLAQQAEEWAAEEEGEALALLSAADRGRDGAEVLLDPAALGRSSRRLARAALRALWRREGWPMGEMGLEHWDGAAGVCLGEAAARDLPGGLRVRRVRGLARLGPAT